ncbi:MAG: hypothetical protein C5B48_05400 [Candidatus Rokuibacteriota bacterium]|nr:MAG: hypothetical protein C5B48_05400 [Candidatus Rokubacteria bacterium]
MNAKALSTYMGQASVMLTLDCYGRLRPRIEGPARLRPASCGESCGKDQVMADARLIGAAVRAAVRNPVGYVREAVRLPLRQEAAKRMLALPVVELADLTGVEREVSVVLPSGEGHHGWSLRTSEQVILQVLLRARACMTAFEIGTFGGETTRLVAETLPEHGRVWTIDLPPSDFDLTQDPGEFGGSDIGVAFRSSVAAYKITQLFGDSLRFDFSAYEKSADFVLVDAGHEYANGFADTRTALRLVRPGGIILWHDFDAYWHGLVNGICDAMVGRRLGRLAGTAFAVYCHP